MTRDAMSQEFFKLSRQVEAQANALPINAPDEVAVILWSLVRAGRDGANNCCECRWTVKMLAKALREYRAKVKAIQ